MLQTKFVQEIKTHLMFNKFFFLMCLCKIMWKNIVEPDRPHMAVECMHFASWVPKATDTCSEYEIFNTFLQQQWLRKCASMLCLYIYCLPCCFYL